LSRNLTNEIYLITKEFPVDEKFGLISQIRRASVSITLKIAEDTSRRSDPEKIRFLEISYGSTMEVLNILILASDQNVLDKSSNSNFNLRTLIEELTNKLNKLRSS